MGMPLVIVWDVNWWAMLAKLLSNFPTRRFLESQVLTVLNNTLILIWLMTPLVPMMLNWSISCIPTVDMWAQERLPLWKLSGWLIFILMVVTTCLDVNIVGGQVLVII